jgi:hypothetical protein
MTIISDATIWSITYDHNWWHYLRQKLARIVNYDCNCSFIVLATVIKIINYYRKTFIVQATGRNGGIFKHRWTFDFILITFVNAKWMKFKPNFVQTFLQSFAVNYKSFLTKTFCFDWILYQFISFMTKIFCSAQISELPRFKTYAFFSNARY